MKKDRDAYDESQYNSYYEQERGDAELLHDTKKENKKKIVLISVLLLALGALAYTGYKALNLGEDTNTTSHAIQNLSENALEAIDVNNSELNNSTEDSLSAELAEAQLSDSMNKDQEIVALASDIENTKANETNSSVIDTYNKVVVENGTQKDDLTSKIDTAVESNQGANAQEYNAEISTRTDQMTVIIVQKGDTLGSLAHKAYGDATQYKKIFEANPSLKNPNRLYVGERLSVPQ